MNTNKKKSVPNSLIIYIKTRIPNYYKLTYSPSMSVPGTKSNTVYFDPLVKYYGSSIRSLPSGSPKSLLVSQFFEPGQFDTMINRTLSSFIHMQPIRTLKEATEQGLIDNNIRLTLNTLFRNNNVLTIGKKPYTIVGLSWTPGDWQIDSKPIEKLITPYSQITGQEIGPTKEEWSEIPEIVRQGNAVSSSLVKDEILSKVENAINKQEQQNVEIKSIQEYIPIITNKKLLKEMPSTFKQLYGKFLQKNDPINYSDQMDLTKDPITLSLLINNKALSDFVKSNQESELVNCYNNFIDSKEKILISENKYIDTLSILAKKKKVINDYFLKTINKIKASKNKQLDMSKTIEKVKNHKVAYLKVIYEISEYMLDIYNSQNFYFVSLIKLLEQIKINYIKIIKFYKIPELAIKCIDQDINTYNVFIYLDTNNPYSKSYFDNLNRFKTYWKLLNDVKLELLEPQINFQEEINKYTNDPGILFMEKYQYDLYSFKILLFHAYNQMDIWNNVYNNSELFTKQVANYSNTLLKISETNIITYNSKYNDSEQNELIKNGSGLRASYDKSKNKLNWFLVDICGNKIYNDKTKKIILEQQQQYIKLVQSNSDSYDSIVLYIYLMEIQCLRQSKVYIAEENINQLNIEYSMSLKEYYNTIKISIEELTKKGNPIIIPQSILWDISNFTNITFLKNRINTNNKSWIIYKNRISDIHNLQKNLDNECEKLIQLVTPNISQTGFIEQCNNILTASYPTLQQYTSKSSHWATLQLKNYDINTSNDLIYNLSNAVEESYNEGMINNDKPNGLQDWYVFDNIGGGDCLFASVVEALNGQLDLMDATTNNIYTEVIDGKNRYTILSLRKMVSDNFDQSNYDFYCSVLSGSNCPFDAKQIDYSLLSDDLRGIYNLLVDNNKNVRTLDEVKQHMSTPCDKTKGCYWADQFAINSLQNILKIKFIIFDMTARLSKGIFEGDRVLYKGDEYRVSDINSGQYTLENSVGDIIPAVSKNEISYIKGDSRHNFRIECSTSEQTIDFKDFIYILKKNVSPIKNSPVYHYEFVRNMKVVNYVINFQEIPEYIKYLIYDNCYRFLKLVAKDKTGFYSITNFRNQFIKYDSKLEETKKIIRNNIEIEEAQNIQIDLIREQKDLEQQLALLKLDNPQDNKKISQIEDKLLQVNNQLTKVMKRVELLESGKPIFGGQTDQISKPINPYIYPYQFNPYIYPYQFNQQQYNYNGYKRYDPAIYKAKERESKFAYYVNIELELYPGTSVNALQKSAVKCQSTFERIREAYADLFGYQYRPASLNEAYAYQFSKKEESTSNKEEKKGGTKKIKSYKKNKSIKYRKL
jgi:hypothetical protein